MTRKTTRRGRTDYREGSCETGKIRYPTEAKARKALKHGRGNAATEVRTVYLCESCGGYHLSKRRHKDKRQPRPRP